MKTKTIRLNPETIKINKFAGANKLHLNLGLYRKGDVDTWKIYNSISEGHKGDSDVWIDIQDNQLIGVWVNWYDKKR